MQIRLTECVSRVGDLNLLTPHIAVSATSMATATSSGLRLMSTAPASGWEIIEITVDLGACDTVIPSSMLSSIKTESTPASRSCQEYEVADGHTIVNEGQKRGAIMTPGSQGPKGIVFQVSSVHKTWMSVGCMMGAGYE